MDLWAGLPEDAPLALFSSGKGAAHLIVALLVQDGTLDLDRPVTDYWPEFPTELSLRDLLAHKAGLIPPGVDLVTGEHDHFLLGFEAQGVRYPQLGPDAFGHSGAVGAQSFADPSTGIAYSYTRDRFAPAGGGGAQENRPLINAVLRSVDIFPGHRG